MQLGDHDLLLGKHIGTAMGTGCRAPVAVRERACGEVLGVGENSGVVRGKSGRLSVA